MLRRLAYPTVYIVEGLPQFIGCVFTDDSVGTGVAADVGVDIGVDTGVGVSCNTLELEGIFSATPVGVAGT
jgi:hypothetical protein